MRASPSDRPLLAERLLEIPVAGWIQTSMVKGKLELPERIDWPLLISGLLGSLLSGLSARIFLISLPSLASGLQTDILTITWALISYQLPSISFSVIFGRLGDMFGPARIYGLGFAIFTVGSFLCGASRNALQLIGFRFFQGTGSAMAQATGRVLVIESMPEGSEGKASALMTIAYHLGFFIGPPLGGFIIDAINWRWIFFFLVPVGIAGMALARSRSGSTPDLKPNKQSRSIDYLGSGMLIVLTVTLIVMLDRKFVAILTAQQTVLVLLGSVGTFAWFLFHEHRAPNPIINLSLFKIRIFSCSIVSLLAYSITHGLVGFVLPFYLQDILRLSPSAVGVIFLVPAFFTISLAYFSGLISDKIGPRIPASAGLLVSIGGHLIGAGLNSDSSWILPTLMLGLLGIGTAFFTSPNQAAILGYVPRGHRGFATGILNTTYGLGNLLGISLGGTILTIAFQHYSGIPGASPQVENASAFVHSININYLAATALTLIALFTSMVRGDARTQAIVEPKHSHST